MASLLASKVTTVKSDHFAGLSSKKRTRRTVSFTDAVNGLTIGGTTNKILATALGFQSFVDNCSNLVVFTTATNAVVAAYVAVPDPTLTFITIVPTTLGTVGDVTISSSQTGQLTAEGY